MVKHAILTECFDNLICSENSSTALPFCLLTDYKKDFRPDTESDPQDIFVHLNIDDIIDVNDYDTTVTLILTLSIGWKEPRLQILPNSSDWIIEDDGETWVKLNPQWLQYLWIPDMDILNMKEFKTKMVFNKLASLELYGDKILWYDIPVEIKLTCPLFRFEDYPLDRQLCELMVGSYQYYSNEMRYTGSIAYDKKTQRPLQYQVKSVATLPLHRSIFASKEYWLSDNGTMDSDYYNYSRFVVIIELERAFQTHAMRTYFPTSLFVVSSWIGFFIDADAIPGRIALSVTLLLVLIGIRYVEIKMK